MKTALLFSATVGLLGLLIVSGCQPQQSPTPSTGSGFRDLSLDAALKQAGSEDKIVMVDFNADWCPPCRMLDEKTWPDAKVQEWLRAKTVAVKINVDKEKEMWGKYNFDKIPTIIFLKPDGTELGRLTGFRPPADFLKEAEGIVAGKKS